MERQSTAGPAVTQNIKKRQFQLALTQKQWFPSYFIHTNFRNVAKRTEVQWWHPLLKEERLWVTRYQGRPKGWFITAVLAKWINGPHNKWECISFTVLGIMCDLSMVKSSFSQSSLPCFKRLWFPKEMKPLPSGMKADKSHGWDPSWMRGYALFLPSTHSKGQGKQLSWVCVAKFLVVEWGL